MKKLLRCFLSVVLGAAAAVWVSPIALRLLAAETAEPVPYPVRLARALNGIQALEDSRHAWMNDSLFAGVAGQTALRPYRTAVAHVHRLL